MKATTTAAYTAPLVEQAHAAAHLPLLTGLDVPATTLMMTLYRALRACRPHGSMAESQFVGWLANRLPLTRIDAAGNLHVDLRRTDAHRTMFTSHTDSVHRKGGANPIHLDATNPKAVKWRASKGQALGADDGAGIALMAHMIEAGVPGLYVFFRGEEVGGIGSHWMADNMPGLVSEIDRCISFDRADYSDIITHQGMGRCCSDKFAEALASALTSDDMTTVYAPDPTGSFTDSANFTDLIGECTNVSVGYRNQHGDYECQDVTYLPVLAARLTAVAWDELPNVRTAGEPDEDAVRGVYGGAKGNAVPLDELVIEALVAALDGCFMDLDDLVCEWLHPEDPWEMSSHVRTRRVSAEKLDRLLDGLQRGHLSAEGVLEKLGDIALNN
jgi:hypothetical protein